jgi:hypothetical protein
MPINERSTPIIQKVAITTGCLEDLTFMHKYLLALIQLNISRLKRGNILSREHILAALDWAKNEEKNVRGY